MPSAADRDITLGELCFTFHTASQWGIRVCDMLETTQMKMFTKLLPFVLSEEAALKTWYVSDQGLDENDCQEERLPCKTLQTVLDTAPDGVNIEVTSPTLHCIQHHILQTEGCPGYTCLGNMFRLVLLYLAQTCIRNGCPQITPADFIQNKI